MFDFEANFPLPRRYRRADGSNRYAYLTFVLCNDSYIPGALLLAHGLRRQNTAADLVCLVSPRVSPPARAALEALYDRVVEVDEIFVDHCRRQERQDRPFWFTRFNALRAGEDGDLGLRYEKIVLADADVLPLRCYDHLFTLNAPAGILNEAKERCLEYDEVGQFVLPESVAAEGKWNWHRIYEPVCPHGAPIPACITERVRSDSANLGINGSLMVLRPSMSEFEDILRDVERPTMHSLVGAAFNWPDMQYATLRWSGRWTSIDLRFSSFKGYPHPSVLCGMHFAGYKPWNFKEPGAMKRFSRFADFRLWFERYLEMLELHPDLLQLPRLARLREQISSLQVTAQL
jgi:glycogenin glucosyltransferase